MRLYCEILMTAHNAVKSRLMENSVSIRNFYQTGTTKILPSQMLITFGKNRESETALTKAFLILRTKKRAPENPARVLQEKFAPLRKKDYPPTSALASAARAVER